MKDLSGWDFGRQNLAGASLWQSMLEGANLTEANLSYANLNGSKLTNANFRNANLTHANLSHSTLSGANFSSADTRGANFEFTPLFGAITSNLIQSDGHIAGLNLAVGEKLIAFPAVPIPVKVTGGFSIAPTSTFDLTDNVVIVDYTDPSPVAVVREKIISGRGGPGLGSAWTGTGFTSSTAAAANQTAPDSRSLGYTENANLPLGPYTTFHGASVDNTAVLIAFTRTGDANLDGVVNNDDVTIVGANYAPGFAKPNWALGDFDYNGFVDNDDVTLLGAFYDPSAAPLIGPPAEPGASLHAAAEVPEPNSLTLFVGLVTVVLCARYCRKPRTTSCSCTCTSERLRTTRTWRGRK
jgi:hypothetical protein